MNKVKYENKSSINNISYKVIETSLKNRIGKIHNPFDINRKFFECEEDIVYSKKKDESLEEFKNRIEGYKEIEIGAVYLDNSRCDTYIDTLYLDFGIHQNFRFSIPRISLMYVDLKSTSINLDDGRYTLMSKLKVYNGKIYIDINNMFLKNNMELIKLNTLVLLKADYETLEEYEKRINLTPYINFGVVKLIEEKYITEEKILPIKIGIYKWVKAKNDILKSFIKFRLEDLKNLSEYDKTVPLYGKMLVFEGELQIVDTFIYLEKPKKMIPMFIEEFSFSIKRFKEANEGNEESMVYIGDLYKSQNKNSLALKWYNKALEKGSKYAIRNIRGMYESELSRDKSLAKYFETYKMIIADGVFEEGILLGNMYRLGIKVKPDYKKAYDLYKEEYKKDNSVAAKYIAKMYKSGIGVEKDINRAIDFYKKSAEMGDGESKLQLGMIYEFGVGNKKDLNEALKWYKSAEKSGVEEAKEYKEDIEFRLGCNKKILDFELGYEDEIKNKLLKIGIDEV